MAQKYTWKQGDNLGDLATKYNTTRAAILEANPGLTQPLAGVVLTIPGVTTLAGDPRGQALDFQNVRHPLSRSLDLP